MTQDIVAQINQLKKQRDAVILAHNYQIGEIQDIADFTGDSLELSRKAAAVKESVIVFCGVHFMAETASILAPEKTVIVPDEKAGCPMANMITAEQLVELKSQHPDALVVCYVNSTADVKAHCDYCCTSGNAVKLVGSLPRDREIIFVPDRHLGSYVEEQLGRKLILWPGYCATHVKITVDEIVAARAAHPGAPVIVHPECPKSLREAADYSLSTGQMVSLAAESSHTEFLIGTELGMLHRLRKDFPDKKFYPVSEKAICPNMKKNTVEKLLWSLENMEPIVKVPAEIAKQALRSLENMVAVL
ncbi:MAG: quinolinate synthase NadA [Sedimentisphaerales bacterium]|nr:quinolinate synthase NadA [Sedimentisphaerales bacterium]